MNMKKLQKHWNELGKIDPLWSIMVEPSKRGGKWDGNEFFRTGKDDIDSIMMRAEVFKLPASRDTAMDFGCGVGRLTQTLCDYFPCCVGVDIAPSMIELAKKYNRHGNKCKYVVNESNDLKRFGENSFDFIITLITLQHMKPVFSKNYIKEILRVLRPHGLFVFQIPSEIKYKDSPNINTELNSLTALPDEAFRAEITVEDTFIEVELGSPITLNVKIKNISDFIWPNSGDSKNRFVVNLGNHWYKDGRMLVLDDARVGLPNDLKPEEDILLTLVANPPNTPGNYILELDMVQEGVAWFHEKGSITSNVHVKIKKHKDASLQIADDVFVPTMEMYGIPKGEILKLISDSGGRLLVAEDNLCTAPPWTSFTYWVTKD